MEKTKILSDLQTVIINMTPHDVNLIDQEGNELFLFPRSGQQIRLAVKTVADEPIYGVPTSRTEFGDPEGLPPYEEGIYYIVSQLVKNALPNRADLLVPAEVVRDEKGTIIGCQSLGR